MFRTERYAILFLRIQIQVLFYRDLVIRIGFGVIFNSTRIAIRSPPNPNAIQGPYITLWGYRPGSSSKGDLQRLEPPARLGSC